MNFEFATATRIIFGPGKFSELPGLVKALGTRPFLVTGKTNRHNFPAATSFAVPGEPTFELIRRGQQIAKQNSCDVVVSVGGGSVIDAGKAIAMLLANGGDPLDYAEVIGSGLPIVHPSIPFIAVPTTAGAGSEVTRNAVLLSPEHKVKVSLRSPRLLPAVALVDPMLTYELPPALTAATGMDALSQLIEPFVSLRANPLTDAICREAIPRAARSLQRAFENGRDSAAREEMSFASLCGGLALANAGLGAVHGFAAAIGGMFDAPHGAVCAVLLPHVFDLNHRALVQRSPKAEFLDRMELAADLLLNKPRANFKDAVYWLAQLAQNIGIKPLRTYGLNRSQFDEVIAKAQASSSMKGNPVKLADGELREILERAY